MAAKKNEKNSSANKAVSEKKKKAAESSKASTRAKADDADTERYRAIDDPYSLINQILPFVFFVFSVFFFLILIMNHGASGIGVAAASLKNILLGLLSTAAYAIPLTLFNLGAFWRLDAQRHRLKWRLWCIVIAVLITAAILQIIGGDGVVYNLKALYDSGRLFKGGGVIGGLIGSLFLQLLGKALSLVLLFSALFVAVLLMFGLTPHVVYSFFLYRAKKRVSEMRNKRKKPVSKPELSRITQLDDGQAEPAVVASASVGVGTNIESRPVRRAKFNPDVDVGEDEHDDVERDIIDKKIFDEVMRRTNERYGRQVFPDEIEGDKDKEKADSANKNGDDASEDIENLRTGAAEIRVDKIAEGELDLSKIFVNPDSIELLKKARPGSAENNSSETLKVEKTQLSVQQPQPDIEVPEPAPVYKFPPLSLLTEPPRRSAADIEELEENARKLVETLASFNVHTRIADVSRGPTITRYELTPESGTRVRSISNLVDDISLNLATQGVRIESPIPGKAAVGIEVPNKTREIVYLRELLENKEFQEAKSRLTVALGYDVAGNPVYCDIAKMPHMLIAGATGMGKSVCINSIIVSLIYKSTPQEVRLILVDPKKVELNIYNGMPHLHVPVISEPSKAAGTLAWAVTEMERRYELIESVGVRNIQNYNEITYGDPEKEFMPQMVIIIDELADLMMTAPDDVEGSICRIAQMGRAAGLHLIIGTQRPSVDVVTGLIKANVPSRIAFTMASQVDSRTIIDIAGAEKLIGRGDMLYAPVGALKPIRVQGAFVSEAEVEKVIDFLKGIYPTPLYDDSAMDGIEEAAERCAQGKKGRGVRGADDDDGIFDDPMLDAAVELAIESGKISTSLIQRRLSLGYGRAAKLIDRMEALGYVSPPDGQRPRDVLITRQQYLEMKMRGTDAC